MLTSFTCARTYIATRVVVIVDCETRECDVMVTHRGIIVRSDDYSAAFRELSSPEAVNAWISKHIEAIHATNERLATAA